MRNRSPEDGILVGVVIVVAVVMLWLGTITAPFMRPAAKPIPLKPDQVIQIKLRDLIGLVPDKGQGAAVLKRLGEIESRLASIEALLRGPQALPPQPQPQPAVPPGAEPPR